MRRTQLVVRWCVGGLALVVASGSTARVNAAPPRPGASTPASTRVEGTKAGPPSRLAKSNALAPNADRPAMPVSEAESFESLDEGVKSERTIDEYDPVVGARSTVATPPVRDRPSGATLDDGQILAVLHAAHRAEMQKARAAVSRGRSPIVQQLAVRLLADQVTQQRALERVSAALNLQPKESALADELGAEATRDAITLVNVREARFDRRFLELQRSSAKRLETLFTDRLASEAQDDTVRALVTRQARRARRIAALSRSLEHDLREGRSSEN